ncbi:hypothetical protein SLEP1_g16585 [Rubroshorea leprosula]|uniref:Uncharacterized protein n=1 Tax=Rubroshorea leprosula TaxID=152421 RepID=A0AAV5IRC9_9ROSI|nr:hypothetical protein SLEP1_g16585 [Rubroshorea leprosula]
MYVPICEFYHFEKLATNGAKMVIISNYSRRASTTMNKVKSLGLDPSVFEGVITSGELMHQYFQRRDDPWFAALGIGRSCIHITWSDRGPISLEKLSLFWSMEPKPWGFPLVTSPVSLEDLEKMLEQCASKRIPMIVANLDFVTVEARALLIMPGTLAAKYEKLGGEVKWMGKPDQIIYKSAMVMVGVDASDSIAVGDSLHYDIKGANEARIA